MTPDVTDTLCTTCGLCCDGSLFADVELAGRGEATALETLGLEIEDADEGHRGLLLLPCRALKGTRCGIYPHRPECCRTFECRLLQEVRRGVVDLGRAREKVKDALGRIAHIQLLLVTLGQRDERLPLKERCAEAQTLSEEDATDPAMRRRRDELETAMASVESFILETFLVDGRADSSQETRLVPP